MAMNRWKVLACTLTIGVGGLAVFAGPQSGTKADPSKEPATLPPITVKPASPVNGDDTQAPATLPVKAEEPAKPTKVEGPAKPNKADEFEFVLPLPMIPALPPTKAPEPTKPADLPVFEPIAPLPIPLTVLPAAGEDTKAPAKPGEPKKPEVDSPPPISLPSAPKPDLKEPTKPMAPLPEPPKVPTIDLGPVPPRATPLVPVPDLPKPPMLEVDDLPPPPRFVPVPSVTPMAPVITQTVSVSPIPTKPLAADAKLKMLLRIGDGQPRFEIRNSATTDLLLKVYGEKIELAPPPEGRPTVAGVMAIGRVKFTAPGVEGTCDHLTILTNSGEVMLKGNIHMKTKYGKAWSEMTADKMVYQIGTTGLSAPTRPTVRPASYIPD